MKLNRQNKIIVGVLALILTITVGYAVFSQSLNITGTAKAEGNFSLIFSSVGEIEQAGSINATANISTDGKTLSVSAPNLQYPSAYVNINAKIKNEGTVKAILKKIEIKDENNNAYSNDNNDITVTYSKVKVNDIFESNEEKDILITITWKKESIKKDVNASFNITLEYEQATSLADSGSVEGGSESDWTFKVNDTGLITAYNYEKGTDAVVPAEVDGIPVTSIDEYSFLNANLVSYENSGLIYMIINEGEPNWTNVKEKMITFCSSGSCDEGDTSCVEQIKQMMYFCKDENTCYSASDESIIISIPESSKRTPTSQGGALYANPDPNVLLEESFTASQVNISTLDLSGATNLTTIEEYSFRNAELQSVNFGENSNLKTIGNNAFCSNQISSLEIPNSVTSIGHYAFYLNQISSLEIPNSITSIGPNAFSSNQISNLTIPNSVTSIGDYAFQSNPLTSILIKRTQSDFLANVTVGSSWYGYGSPTITYEP